TTALIAPAMREALQSGSPAVILTIHDQRRTGSFDRRIGAALESDLLKLESLRHGENLSSLRGGILAADGIVVPSESHVELLAQSGDAMGLGSWFSDQSRAICAVQPGVDYSRVNPATNPCLASRYDAEDSTAKIATKTAVLREIGLELDGRPFVMFPGPITEDGGGDLVISAMDSLLEQPLSIGIWSMANDSPYLIAELKKRISGRAGAAVHCTYKSEDDLHRAFAAADFVVCPHRHLGGRVDYIASQRYGAVVVALNSPGLRDVIVDCDAALETGTGFLFGEPTGEALSAAVMRANAAFYHPNFQRLRRRVMRQDCSWERPARRMLQIYKKALGSKSRAVIADTLG
ncbi:MAG TPA: glycosyltransferase, partial [Polyangiaceae bacterium]|nr:glycosyltransferase [Polyangiaceae bacterium]